MTLANASLLACPEDSVLVIIDIQTKLTSVMPVKVLARLQRNSSLLLRTAELLGVPVIATEQYPKGLGEMEPTIVSLLPDDVTRIEKTCFSCTDADEFMEKLESTGRKQVLLMGMEAHICVLQTAMSLINKDYTVFSITDAVCSRQRENYETALERMLQAGVINCDSESVVFEWMRDAQHEHFKAVSKMIR